MSEALEAGYRHIDTAEMYGNERGVGEAVRASGLARDEVFVTSKLSNASHRPDDARRAFDATLSELGFDYVDLFLIHWPLPTLYDGDFVSTWRTLEEFQRDGRARSIGVSNFADRASRAAGRGDGHRAGGEPGRGPPLLPQRRRPRLRAGARHRDPGLVAAGAGQGPGRPRHRCHRRQARAYALAGRAALAHPAWRCRVPQDRSRRRACARTSTSSTSSSEPGDMPRWRRSTGAPPGAPVRTRTRSTGCPDDALGLADPSSRWTSETSASCGWRSRSPAGPVSTATTPLVPSWRTRTAWSSWRPRTPWSRPGT